MHYEYERKRGVQYYDELVEDPANPDLVIRVTKQRRAMALQWEGPNRQVYRAPATPAGKLSLDRRRWEVLGFTNEQIAAEIAEEP